MDKYIIIGDWRINIYTGGLWHIPCRTACTAWMSDKPNIHPSCQPDGGNAIYNIIIPDFVLNIVRSYQQ